MKRFMKRVLATVIALLLAFPAGFGLSEEQAMSLSDVLVTSYEEVNISDAVSVDATNAADEESINSEDEVSSDAVDPEIGEADEAELGGEEDPAPEAAAVTTYWFLVNDELYSEQTVGDGGTIQCPDEPEAPEGYIFSGWFLEDGTQLFVDKEEIAYADPEVPFVNVLARFEDAPEPGDGEALPGDEEAAPDDAPVGTEEKDTPVDEENNDTFTDVEDKDAPTDADATGESDTDITGDGAENAGDGATTPEAGGEENATPGDNAASGEDKTPAPEEGATPAPDAEQSKDGAENTPEKSETDATDEDQDADSDKTESDETSDGESESSDGEQGETGETSDEEKGEEAETQEDEAEIQPVRVTFSTEPEDAVVTVFAVQKKDEDAGEGEVEDTEQGEPEAVEAEEDGSWLLMPGEFVYNASAEGYISVEAVPFTVTDGALEINIELEAVEGEKPEEEPVPFNQSCTIGTVTITVRADAGAFPAGAELKVSLVNVQARREADEAIGEIRDEDVNVAAAYTYDIKVVDAEGNELQPVDGYKVEVSFAMAQAADENLEANVYHVTEEDGELKAEKLEAEAEGETVTAVSEGFSIYTVEFTYNKLEFVLQGDTSIHLATILTKLGLGGNVIHVECSNTNLFSADWSETETQWIVTAHQAFSSTEWMKVTIQSTVTAVYEITVTDDNDTSGTCGDGLTWTMSDENHDNVYETLTISKTGEGMGEMNDYTSAEAPWYGSRTSITSVVIRDDVTSIGTYAFYGCSSLTSVTIPDSVMEIYDDAFEGCANLADIYYGDTPENWSNLFYANAGVPDTTAIHYTNHPCGQNATWSLTGAGSLTVSGTGAMYDFEGNDKTPWCYVKDDIMYVVIENGVTSIGNNAFDNCDNLSLVTFGADSRLESIGEYAFRGCKGLWSIAIPEGVTSIGEYAFSNTNLNDIVIPEGVTTIGKSVFEHCLLLDSVTFGASSQLESIGDSAFTESNLNDIVIPEGVTSIGDKAFKDCARLEDATLPGSVTTLGDYAFNGCNNLVALLYPKDQGSFQTLLDGSNAIDILPEHLKGFSSQQGAIYIYVAANDASLGSVSGGGLYAKKENYGTTLRAYPADGCNFIGWRYNDNTDIASTEVMQTISIEASMDATAVFGKAFDDSGIVFEPTATLPTTPGNYYLTTDVTLDGVYWEAPSGMTRICLNGHTINTNDGYLLADVGETLEIYEHDGQSGSITSSNAYALTINEGGMIALHGGTIQGKGGGYESRESDTGVSVVGGTFTMTGGKITGFNDGGVQMIDGTFNVSGNSMISGNTEEGAACDVYLANGTTITVAGPLTSGSSIGVRMASPGVFTTGYGFETGGHNAGVYPVVDGTHYFFDDTGEKTVGLKKASNAENAKLEAALMCPWQELQSRISYQPAGNDGVTSIQLAANVTAHSDDAALNVPTGRNVAIDLNGCTIDRNLTSAQANGSVITVNGTLTVTGSGTITGGYNSGDGGGVVVDGGQFILTDSASVSGNTTSSSTGGGGVYVSGGTFEMTGGSVTRNTAAGFGDGGGVYVGGNKTIGYGSFTMSGSAIISLNSCGYSGGGVYVGSGCIATLSGGSITQNTANRSNGGGVYMYDSVNISGAPTITSNVKGGTITDEGLSGGTANNVYLNTDNVMIVTDALTEGAHIGVTMKTYGAFTRDYPKYCLDGSGKVVNPATWFSSDARFKVGLTDNNEVELAPYKIRVTLDGIKGADGKPIFKYREGSALWDETLWFLSGDTEVIGLSAGQSVVLKAGDLQGFSFINWEENHKIIGTDLALTLSNVQTDHEIIAHYLQSHIVVSAALEGRDWQDDDAFTFKVAKVEDGAPKPPQTDRVIEKTTADHSVAFGNIPFTGGMLGNTYHYKVTQTMGDVFGIAYDTSEKTVTYDVKEREGGGVIELKPSPVQEVSFTNRYIPPTVTGDTRLTYGESGSLAVSFDKAVQTDGFDLTCQWYSCDADGNNPKAINGATGLSYAIPATLDVGEHYFFCEVTGTHKTSGKANTVTTAVGKVTIKPAAPTSAVTPLSEFRGDVSQTATAKPVGNTILAYAWSKVEGAEGYDLFFKKCDGKGGYGLIQSITDPDILNSEVSGLKKGTAYKAYVRAWRMENGVKTYIGEPTPYVHAIAGGYNKAKRICNASGVTVKQPIITLKVRRKRNIKASVKGVKKGYKVLKHVARLRYYSSDTSVAKVNKKGRITAVAPGTCTIYVMANNGVYSTVTVTVSD